MLSISCFICKSQPLRIPSVANQSVELTLQRLVESSGLHGVSRPSPNRVRAQRLAAGACINPGNVVSLCPRCSVDCLLSLQTYHHQVTPKWLFSIKLHLTESTSPPSSSTTSKSRRRDIARTATFLPIKIWPINAFHSQVGYQQGAPVKAWKLISKPRTTGEASDLL